MRESCYAYAKIPANGRISRLSSPSAGQEETRPSLSLWRSGFRATQPSSRRAATSPSTARCVSSNATVRGFTTRGS